MAPNEDPERPRASSAAERQKSIVSMTEFEGMDEYTALQKYILFYRDSKTNPHAEQTVKKKAWWQFWKSGSATAATAVADPGAVPEDCKYLFCLFARFPPTFYLPIGIPFLPRHCKAGTPSRAPSKQSVAGLQSGPCSSSCPASEAIAARRSGSSMQPDSTKPPASATPPK